MGIHPALSDLLMEDSWREVLQSEFQKPYWTKLQQFLHEEWGSQKIFPPQHLIFRSTSALPAGEYLSQSAQHDPSPLSIPPVLSTTSDHSRCKSGICLGLTLHYCME